MPHRMWPMPSTQSTSPPQRFVWPVVQQHVEEAAHLRQVRSVLVRAPHVALDRLARLDERIEAHIDGMVVSAPAARKLALQELNSPTMGSFFAAASLALSTQDFELLDHLYAVAAAMPEASRGLAAALGWAEPAALRRTVRDLLASALPEMRALGIQACALHRVDPGQALAAAAQGDHLPLRAAALRAAAVLGRADMLHFATSALAASLDADDAAVARLALAASFAACRFGQGVVAVPTLERLSQIDDNLGLQALWLGLSSVPVSVAMDMAGSWGAAARKGASPLAARRAIQSVALLGRPEHVPWLIERMSDPKLMRVAGEAFSWITGIDLAEHDLETLSGPDLPQTPSDDPAATDVALDEDESLPWPNPAKLHRWWQENGPRLAGLAAPVFMGQSTSDDAALIATLRSGRQRQRHHAAWLLALRRPGTALFNTAAPARRQQRALGGVA